MKGNFNALSATLLGVGGLVIIDIGKYYFIDVDRMGWIGDSNYEDVAALIYFSTALILVSYRVSKRSTTANRQINTRAIDIERTNGKLLKILIIPAAVLTTAIETQSHYINVVVGAFQGAAIFLFIYSMIKKDYLGLFVAAISLTVLVGSSSRREYIAVFIPLLAALGLIYRNRYGQLRWYLKAGILTGCLIAFVFLNALRAGHDFGEGFDPNDPVKNTISYMTKLKSIDTFFNTAHIYRNFPSVYPYYMGETYFAVLVAIVPRSMWREKPVGLGAPLAMTMTLHTSEFDQGLWESINMFSLSPGFVGEAYANFGFVGVIMMSVLLGFVAGRFDSSVQLEQFSMRNVPILTLLSTFVLIQRGDFYSAVFYQIFLFIGLMRV